MRKAKFVMVLALALCAPSAVVCMVAARASGDVSLVNMGQYEVYLRGGRIMFDHTWYLGGAAPDYSGHFLHVHHEEHYLCGNVIYCFSDSYAYLDRPGESRKRACVSFSAFALGPIFLWASVGLSVALAGTWFMSLRRRKSPAGFDVVGPRAPE